MMNFKRGDKVSVRQSDDEEWYEAIYVGTIEGITFPYFTVRIYDKEQFAEGRDFRTIEWKQIKAVEPTSTNQVIKLAEIKNKQKKLW